MKVRRLVNTLCKSLLKLEVKTLLHTDRHAKCNSSQDNNNKTIAFTLKKKQAKALIKTLAKSQGDVDVQTLRKTLLEVKALPRSRH